jgi:predicted DNA-binding transcriptional regulator AlpA
MKKYLDEAGAAEYLNLGWRTLQRYRQHGGGPVYLRLGGRRIAYAQADLDEWAARFRYCNRAAEQAAERAALR